MAVVDSSIPGFQHTLPMAASYDPATGKYMLEVLSAGSSPGATATTVIEQALIPLGFERITTLNASTALTVPATSRLALIQAETQNVRWRDDGTAPTGSVGMLLEILNTFVYDGDLTTIRFIEVAASAALNVSYYG